MKITVVIERVASNGYRASTHDPVELTAEAATPEEAVQKLRELVQNRVASGEIVSLDVPVTDNPWLRMAGMWEKGDPQVEEWKRIMEENRRAADADPDYL